VPSKEFESNLSFLRLNFFKDGFAFNRKTMNLFINVVFDFQDGWGMSDVTETQMVTRERKNNYDSRLTKEPTSIL